MPFWNTDKIWDVQTTRVSAGKFLVEGLEEKSQIKHSSCELAVGREVFITSTKHRLKYRLERGDQVEIPPGQFAALLTEEKVWIPEDTLAFISIKAKIKFRGLVNVSGFHVDPGFKGNLVFAVYNAGSDSVVLSRGQRLFPIWFADLGGTDPAKGRKDSSPYDNVTGTHFDQEAIGDDIVMNLLGDVASPAELKRDIDALRRSFAQMKLVAGAIVSAVLAALAAKWFG
jgi:dCTP deaminase